MARRAEQGQEPERREGEEKRSGEKVKKERFLRARREERLGAGSTRGKIWRGSTGRGRIWSRLHKLRLRTGFYRGGRTQT
jgi:hypothetical protein